MPNIPCSYCGARMVIEIGEAHIQPSRPKKLVGTVFCRECDKPTGIELENNMPTFISSKQLYGNLVTGVTTLSQILFTEAETSFRAGCPNAAATMCRAAIEIALSEKGIAGDSLFEMINNAKSLLGETVQMLAHGSRLVTRSAIHRGELIPITYIPSMLTATVTVLNTLASKST
jgi:hypothetical protein